MYQSLGFITRQVCAFYSFFLLSEKKNVLVDMYFIITLIFFSLVK